MATQMKCFFFTTARVRKYAKFGVFYAKIEVTEVTEGVTSTPEIFSNKHSFVLTFFATNTIYVNCKRCKP